MAGQGIRRSQFITTYGPGAILEGPNGPRVIPTFEQSGLFTHERPVNQFEITDLRLSSALLNGAGIVRLPSNAELGVPETQEVYKTTPFPSWALCTQHHILYLKRPTDTSGRACPRCPTFSHERFAWERVRQQAIRFVQACPDGHLDDVNWLRLMEHRHPNCQPEYLIWQGSGSALRNIEIICPSCQGHTNLGIAYSRTWQCSGRLPERGYDRPGCSAEAQIMQRGATNLRMAEIYSALTIPPADTRLHRLLESSIVRTILAVNQISTKQELLEKLRPLVAVNLLGSATVTELGRFNEDEILAALRQMTPGALPQDNRTLRKQEFEALMRAAAVGAPAQPSSTPGAPPQFEVIQRDVNTYPGPGGYLLRVTPVSRLRVVMVQRGYRRIDPLESQIVDTVHLDETGRRWYCGVELYGEGIFIDLAPTSSSNGWHFPLRNDRPWREAWSDPGRFHQRLQDTDDRDYLHPVFVWWHTLAHRLINALSLDSGYSSAAVRERTYIDINPSTDQARGGILLYTAQPGGDGTLGGLIAQVPHFARVLRVALDTLDSCSNDPLCGEEHFGPGKYNGAACYACQLVSETSCEHRNTRLDRNLLIENMP